MQLAIPITLEFIESYTGNLHLDVVNENIPFVLPINAALEQLGQEFKSFLLIIELNTVAIFIKKNNLFKVFDSHARDLYGMPHPCGSCVLLEFDSVWKLTEYFKFLYAAGAIYELKGVKILNAECNERLQNVNLNEVVADAITISDDTSLNCPSSTHADDISTHICALYTQECSVYIYAICFSRIMTCSYWTYETQSTIIEHAMGIYEALNHENQQSLDHFPASVDICGAQIDVTYTSRHEGTLCFTSLSSKIALETVIADNAARNMGFLIWLSNCFGCIIHNQINRKRPTTKYFIISSAETRELNLFKELPDPHFVVARLCDVLDFNDPNVQAVKYIIQFLSSSSTLKKSEKQKVQRKHKSTKQSKLYKERLCNKNALKYKEMDSGKKRELSITNSLKYKEMERVKKSELRKKNALKYKEMESGKKSELRKKNSLKFKEMDPTKKK